MNFHRGVPTAALISLLAGGMAAWPAVAATKNLELSLYTPMNVDGAAGSASTTLELRNPNAGVLNYSLTVANTKSMNTGADAGWVPAFYGTDNKPAGPLLEGSIGGFKTIGVRLDISQVLEAGESTGDLDCNGAKIAELTIAKDRNLPFRVSLEGDPSEKPVIHFVKGEPLELRLKNEDGMNYPVLWELEVNGITVSGAAMAGANGSTPIPVRPKEEWFSVYRSLFKSDAADGTLRIGYRPKARAGASTPGYAAGYPSRTIPIRAELSYCQAGTRDFWGNLLILLIVALGGLTSAYVNVDLINRIQAVSIKKKVGLLARRIGEIGPRLNSQLRVSLWLERTRISEAVPKSRLLVAPETKAALEQANGDTGVLQKRVELAAAIYDAVIRQDRAIEARSAAPTLMEQVSTNLTAAQELLKKSLPVAEELARIETLLGGALNILNGIGKPDEDLEKTIQERLAVLKAVFQGEILADETYKKILAAAPIPFGALTGNAAHLEAQCERDAQTRKLAVVARMVSMKSMNAGIIDCLRRQDFGSVAMAEQLLAELKDEISVEDLCNEINAEPARVHFVKDRETVRMKTPILMRLMFNQSRYNGAAAKRRIECTWDFGDGLREPGWEVYHYFSKMGTYPVKVTFRDDEYKEIGTSGYVETVVVEGLSSQDSNLSWLEFQRWAVGFGVAVVGLFAGAREKIVTLDTAGIVLALFLLGFGIDVAKNLLVQKSG